jgi:multiple sugar transport system permease protein
VITGGTREMSISKKELFSAPKGFRRYAVNYLGLAPFFVLYITFILIPMIQGIAMSFTDWSTRSRGILNFVGIKNYIYLLFSGGTSSRRFLRSLQNLFVYVPITILIGLSIALVLALIVHQFRGKLYSFFRGAFFIPTVLPLFLCTGIWQWFMAPDVGLVTSILAKIGIGRNIAWTSTSGYAIAICIIIDVWHAAGFNFVILSAGMQDISKEYYEAAEIDGASTFQQMRYITLPLLEPIMFFVITYAFISALQVYDIPWILSNDTSINAIGGPGQVMLFPVMEMVRNVYSGDASGLGRATAEGVMLMTIIMSVTLIQFKARRKRI